jgi:hypothetical protein
MVWRACGRAAYSRIIVATHGRSGRANDFCGKQVAPQVGAEKTDCGVGKEHGLEVPP